MGDKIATKLCDNFGVGGVIDCDSGRRWVISGRNMREWLLNNSDSCKLNGLFCRYIVDNIQLYILFYVQVVY